MERHPLRRGGGGPQPPAAVAAQSPGQKGFSGPKPPTGGKGPGRPGEGRVRRAQTGTPAGGRLEGGGGPGSPLTGSRGPSVPAAALLPRAAPRGPGLPRGRWQDARRAQGAVWPRDPGEAGAGRRWVGPPRSRGERGRSLGARREGAAGRGQRPHPRPSLAPSSERLRQSGSCGRTPAGRLICMSLACHLHRPYARSPAAGFCAPGLAGSKRATERPGSQREWGGKPRRTTPSLGGGGLAAQGSFQWEPRALRATPRGTQAGSCGGAGKRASLPPSPGSRAGGAPRVPRRPESPRRPPSPRARRPSTCSV